MSSGKTFDERLRDIGNGKQADDLLIATHKEPKDPNQPTGISFSEYRSIKLDADRQIRKVRKWRMISIFLLIAEYPFRFSLLAFMKPDILREFKRNIMRS